MKRQNGFSLIEALIAITILGIVIMGVLAMTSMHVSSNYMSQNRSKAVYLAEQRLEEYMAKNFTTLAATTVTEAYETIASFPQFTRTTTVSSVDSNNVSIQVEVSWKTGQSASTPLIMSVRRTR